MAMKRKMKAVVIGAVIMAIFLFGNTSYALTTSATIHLTVRVVGAISLNLEDQWLEQNLDRPEAEAFSELKDRDIYIDRLKRNDSMVWRFTKTQ